MAPAPPPARGVPADTRTQYRSTSSGHPDESFVVRLGPPFFAAGTNGHSSKDGTLIHEGTHFLLSGASADPPKDKYGEAQALALAKSSPAAAQKNAENLEYFVESTYDGMTP